MRSSWSRQLHSPVTAVLSGGLIGLVAVNIWRSVNPEVSVAVVANSPVVPVTPAPLPTPGPSAPPRAIPKPSLKSTSASLPRSRPDSVYVAPPGDEVTGKYTFAGQSRSGILHMRQNDDGTISFRLLVVAFSESGESQSGRLAGVARLKGLDAEYVRRRAGRTCTLHFVFQADAVNLIGADSATACGFGEGVSASAWYTRESRTYDIRR